jgi:hypothetical protein
MTEPVPDGRAFLRHSVATIAYRAGKVLRDAPDGFADLRVGDTTRTPAQILAHMGDLLDWALALSRGEQVWHDSSTLAWDDEVKRFFDTLKRFDEYLESGASVACPVESLFQGPIADALTHVGQLALLRRMSGVAVRGENYFKAEISAGRVGLDQATPRREFD